MIQASQLQHEGISKTTDHARTLMMLASSQLSLKIRKARVLVLKVDSMRAERRKKQAKSVEEGEGALVTEDNPVCRTVKVVSLPSQMISFQVNCSTPSCTCVCVCLVWSDQVGS